MLSTGLLIIRNDVSAGHLLSRTHESVGHLLSGTHVSGIDVSLDRRGWQRKRTCSVALGAFPTVNGIGVSARGRPC